MAKRLSDTEKWMDSWFRRLPVNGKILWLYMLDRCDMAGVWEVDLDLFNLLSGMEIREEEFKRLFGDRIHFFSDNKKVWIQKFISFQNGKLEEDSKSQIILSIIRLLKNHNLWIPYKMGINTLQGRVKEEEKDIIKDKEEEKDEVKRKNIFIKPTLIEVSEYCSERNNNVDPIQWMAHYESNGWKVGISKAPMRNWKATVITWEKREGKFNGTSNDGRSPRRKRLDEDAHRITELAERIAGNDRGLHPAHVSLSRPSGSD